MAKRWTKESDQALLQGIGAYGLAWFQARAGRSHDYPNAPRRRSISAIYGRAYRLFGPGGFTRGVYTLHRAANATGYDRRQLRRAASALNQKWKRLRRRGAYIITEDQLEDICEWLKHDYWCKPLQLYACIWCGTKSSPSAGMGLCTRCYHRHRRMAARLGLPIARRDLHRLVEQLHKAARDGDRFLGSAHHCLRHGRALTAAQLEKLARVTAVSTTLN